MYMYIYTHIYIYITKHGKIITNYLLIYRFFLYESFTNKLSLNRFKFFLQ